MKAVIPASGDGTRMASLMNGKPKELAEINGEPIIRYAIEECVRCGIKDVVIIISEKKKELIQYINDVIPYYKDRGLYINTVYQHQKNGSGGAVLSARSYIGNDDFCVLFPDVFIYENNSNLREMINVFDNTKISVILVDKISVNELERYGITASDSIENGFYNVELMLEKPLYAPDTEFYHGIVGRYVFPNSFIDELEKLGVNDKNEIDLSEALIKVQKIAFILKGKHFECGSVSSYLDSVDKIKELKDVIKL